jgi:hypothetical protein
MKIFRALQPSSETLTSAQRPIIKPIDTFFLIENNNFMIFDAFFIIFNFGIQFQKILQPCFLAVPDVEPRLLLALAFGFSKDPLALATELRILA